MAGVYPELAALLIKLREKLEAQINQQRKVLEQESSKIEWLPIDSDAVERSCVVAVDSSFVLVESRLYPVYLVQGVAQAFTFDGGRISGGDQERFYDAGYMVADPGKRVKRSYYKKALTHYAYLLELKSAYKLAKKVSVDLVLLDGSLLSFMLTRRDVAESITLVNPFEDIDMGRVFDEKQNIIEGMSEELAPVFVAKSSSVNFYSLGYSDFQFLEMLRMFRVKRFHEPGYSKPIDITMDSSVLRFLGLKSTAVKGFVVTYARLSRASQVFQLSVPYTSRRPDVGKVVRILRIFSPAGYPLPLEAVHRISKLSKRQVKSLIMGLGIPTATGREFLEL